MANVSVSGIEGTASEIQGVNDILKNTATNTSTAGDRISKLATEFASYNNQISADNPPHYEQYTEGDSICTYNIYDIWVTTTGGLESRAASLASKADEINSVVDRISSKVADVQTIAVAIQGYIDSIQDILSNSDTMSKCGINLSSGVVASAFLALGRDGVAKANLATSGADINSRNFLDYDSIKDDEKLNGGLLSFEKQDDGSYLIKKDGESTGYYTTGLAAGLYMKTLTTTVGKEYKASLSSATSKLSDSVENLNSDKIDLKEEEIRIHKANESANKNAGTSSSKGNLNSDKIDLKEEEIRIHKANESADKNGGSVNENITGSSKENLNSDMNYMNKLENKEQYTYDSESVLNNQTVKLYKGKSGGYKFVEPTSTGGSRVTYYDKNNKYIYSAILNENGDFLMASGD